MVLITITLFADWFCRSRFRVAFQTHRRRRVKRRLNDNTHGRIRVENDFTAVFGQIHFGPETNDRLSKNDTHQVNIYSLNV